MPRLLEEIEFQNPSRARAQMARLADGLPEAVFTRIQVLLASVPDPDQAAALSGAPAQREPGRLRPHRQFARGARLSDHDFFLQQLSFRSHAAPSGVAAAVDHLRRSAPRAPGRGVRGSALAHLWRRAGVPAPLDLARFRRQQLLRIVLRDVLGLASLSDVTEETFESRRCHSRSRLPPHSRGADRAPRRAPARPTASRVRLLRDLARQAGRPGAELQFRHRSDVRLLGERRDRRRRRRSPTRSSSRRSPTGTPSCSPPTPPKASATASICGCVPTGVYGEVCISLEGARDYYKQRGRDWELQMLIKARVSAGEHEPGRELLDYVEPLIYSTTLDFRAVEAVSETRARIHEKLASPSAASAGLDIKLARGGIRDIEFLVQCLQRLHGGREPWVRHGGTLFALFRLRDKSLLSGSGIRAPGFGLPVPAQSGAPAAIRRGPADPHAARRSGSTGRCWRAACPPVLPPPCSPPIRSSANSTRIWKSVQELYDRLIHAAEADVLLAGVQPSRLQPAPSRQPFRAAPAGCRAT